ncbi:MAG: PAS domain-containing protein, partial [Methanotrichaceae archaeon]|nr:PAS domain-containing protein [Methanotrichaceae archaeon]
PVLKDNSGRWWRHGSREIGMTEPDGGRETGALVERTNELYQQIDDLKGLAGAPYSETLSKALKALDAERRRYQELFDLAPVSYLVTDLWGRIKEANQAAIKMLGSNPVGEDLKRFIRPEDLAAFSVKFEQLRQEGQIHGWEIGVKARHLEGDPGPIHALVAANLLTNFEGEPTGFRWLIRDITERKRME